MSLPIASARGALLAFEFAGTIDSWRDPQNLLGLNVTRAFSGRFTYDTSAVDTDPSSNRGAYAPPLVSCAVGTVSFAGGGTRGEIIVQDDFPDLLALSTYDFASGSVSIKLAMVTLTDEARHALTSDALPLSPSDVQGFPGGMFYAKIGEHYEAYASGALTSWTIAPIPEPSTLILAALPGVLARRRLRGR